LRIFQPAGALAAAESSRLEEKEEELLELQDFTSELFTPCAAGVTTDLEGRVVL